MTRDPSRTDELQGLLVDWLDRVVSSAATFDDAVAWSKTLPLDLLSRQRESGRGNPRAAIASDALDVLAFREDHEPALTVDCARGWLHLLRHPRPPEGVARDLATIAVPPPELARQAGHILLSCIDGLGVVQGWLCESRPQGFWFSCWWPSAETPAETIVQTRPSGDPTEAAGALFETLAIDETDTTWLDPEVDPTKLRAWSLFRTDDNANRVEVMTTRSRAKAEARMAALERTGHRQLYEVVAARDSRGS